MSQKLFLGDNVMIEVDRVFADNGQDAEYVLQGGKRIKMSDGVRKRPMIFQRAKEFFYSDGSPVTNPDDVDYLPPQYRTLALEFIDKRSGVAKNLTKIKPTKGRGRPKKSQTNVLEIKDADSYRKAGGVEV